MGKCEAVEMCSCGNVEFHSGLPIYPYSAQTAGSESLKRKSQQEEYDTSPL